MQRDCMGFMQKPQLVLAKNAAGSNSYLYCRLAPLQFELPWGDAVEAYSGAALAVNFPTSPRGKCSLL